MMRKELRHQKNSYRRSDEQLEQPTCPRCGLSLAAVTTTGPTTYIAEPCGCEIGDYKLKPMSTSYHTDLNAFQRDVLEALARIERRTDTAPCGQDIGSELKSSYDYEEVHSARLYTNLDVLVEECLIERGQRNGRSNFYELTQRGRGMLCDRLQALADSLDEEIAETVAADGGQR